MKTDKILGLIKGQFYPNLLYYYALRGFFLLDKFEYYFCGGLADAVMKRGEEVILFEFGPCRLSKLWEYLERDNHFLVVGHDNSTAIIVKRGKFYFQGLEAIKTQKEELSRQAFSVLDKAVD